MTHQRLAELVPNKISSLCILLALAFTTHNTLADNNRGFFAGGALGYHDASDLLVSNSIEEELRLGTFEIMGGYKYNEWLGVDVRLGLGLSDKATTITSTAEGSTAVVGEHTHSIDSYQSIYYRPEMINKKARWYGLFGYTQFKSTIAVSNGNEQDGFTPVGEFELAESGASIGMGAGWFVNDHLNFNVELKSLINTTNANVNTLTAGFDYRF